MNILFSKILNEMRYIIDTKISLIEGREELNFVCWITIPSLGTGKIETS